MEMFKAILALLTLLAALIFFGSFIIFSIRNTQIFKLMKEYASVRAIDLNWEDLFRRKIRSYVRQHGRFRLVFEIINGVNIFEFSDLPTNLDPKDREYLTTLLNKMARSYSQFIIVFVLTAFSITGLSMAVLGLVMLG